MNTIVEQHGIDEVELEHNDDKRQENCLDLNEYLPENLIFDILARLPIETLCSSRFLCKSWYAIINSPDFKNAHLNRSDTTTTTGLIFFGSSIEIKFMEIKDGGKSTTKEYKTLKIMGCIRATCNGLVVLQHFSDTRGPISLLNPVTREREYLPAASGSPLRQTYGLAFCHVSRRYKLLRLFFMDDDFRGEIMEIGSGRTWRAVDVPPPEEKGSNKKPMIIFAMGALHWIQRVVGRGECLVSMPLLDDEKFKTMAIPAGGDHDKWIFAMGRDQFVGFASQQLNGINCPIGVWVLRPGLGGGGGEWEKQYDIDTSGLRMRRLLYCVVVKGNELVFRCVSDDGRFSFYAYDHRHSPQFVRKVESNDNFRGYFPHVNSLVSWRS